MASEYRPDRRIDPIRRLSAITKNEAAQSTDLRREASIEAQWERVADELKARQPMRSFAELLKKR